MWGSGSLTKNGTGTLTINGMGTYNGQTLVTAGTLDVDGTLQIDGAVTKTTTDLVANFNADLLDGNDSSAFAAAMHGHPGSDSRRAYASLDALESDWEKLAI